MANSASIRTPIAGLDGLRAVLRTLPEKVRTTVMAKAMAKAAKPIVDGARFLAPSRSGALKASITSVVKKGRGGRDPYAVIGPDRGYRRGSDVPANYAHLVEFGHEVRQPKKGTSIRKGTATRARASKLQFVPPVPFLRPAVVTYAERTGQTLADGIASGMAAELRKIRKT